MSRSTTIPDNLLFEFCQLISEVTGHYFPKNRIKEAEDKFYKVMESLHILDPANCLAYLNENRTNEEAASHLAKFFTIGETSFFRDALTYHALENHILPEIIKRHRGDQIIRIWSAGCCTGEEPYSIAMLLTGLIENWKDWKIHVFGTDINPDFLKKGEKGFYTPWSFRYTSKERLEKYFVKYEQGYVIRPEIKKLVKFSTLNLLSGEKWHSSGIHDLDLIICHNVLIYFSKEQINKIIPHFIKAMHPQGWLSIGAIEIPFVHHPLLGLHLFSGALMFRKEGGSKTQEMHPPKAARIPKKTLEPHPKPPEKTIEKPKKIENGGIAEKCQKAIQQKKYDEAITLLSEHFQPGLGDPPLLAAHSQDVILLIHLLANKGEFDTALQWCDAAVKADSLNPAFYSLQGAVLHASGDAANAKKALKKSLFLDPNFVASHYLLGLLEQEQGQAKAAMRYFQSAWDLLEQCQPPEILPGTFDLNAGRLKDFLAVRLGK